MTTTKRAYKLQEFVAHASSVNCLKIGRKSSRVLVTGGEDHKVNLWAIGKPNAILSLSGHSSGIDSVSFDSSEVLVAAGAASGTIKLWDLEEAKIVRTLTGHRSNCISLDFHPFGEFFASGSLDTNLKIWDIRRKGCIHTYKGHTRGVNAIRFTPDGRWVVSGGEDNTVKLWDLTAGKLLHDFKCHEGQIQCIDFHPHEFLLATGSADRTVKFWDLETFELIGSAGPETTGVRCMTFNPDGRTLLCGLHESLRVFSWEPIRCHDAVDVGWSRLSDLNIHEGKLLGCSYNQSCVGVWVVDISRIEPYAVGNVTRLNGHSETKSNPSGNLSVLNENTAKTSLGRLSVSQNSDPVMKETKILGRLSISQNSDPAVKESKSFPSTGSVPGTPQRVNLNTGTKTTSISSSTVPSAIAPKRNMAKVNTTANASFFNRSDVIPVIVPRNNVRLEQEAESRKESVSGRTMTLPFQPKTSDFRKIANTRDDSERPIAAVHSEIEGNKATELSAVADRNTSPAVKRSIIGISAVERNVKDDKYIVSGKVEMNLMTERVASYQHESYETRVHKANRDACSNEGQRADETRLQKANRDACSNEGQRAGRTRSLVANWEKKERLPFYEDPASSNLSGTASPVNTLPANAREYSSAEPEMVSASDEDAISYIMEQHDQFVGSMQSRLAKLQIVQKYWDRNDLKGAITAMEKMADYAVVADVISFLREKNDAVTLDICTSLLPLLAGLLESGMDRHQGISLEMLLKLVRVFGSVIYSSLSASSVGVDIEAEQRLERCNLCFVELEKVKRCLPVLSRRGGLIAKFAQELNLALEEVS
ncbi:katanin p80 WD40 repeat-containing subunit B1 homolog KTN80.4-like [Cornus florida]|uniref:katanin p80 WD40 repeat-containing subunit B1 homolog KTN80.4-like n=1 Tax=Cornus florida TaxID=4283 RepID=UPI00289E631E|nr:katanin p80 WD40 repeat-containing subunit B1 homolog KTN80.4-like [Cornus florida]XP_059656197.1 katanin p80 WD40 repeat-containing subunit B1 homolog KTN80.4-like [Cornus florida]XP_059656199.1 katanin p80 WD40 repeat-containing subunit B1 homolog KTN80.4-like [Cornus florida]